MMELVRHAPETSYELSLKDLVEMPTTERPGTTNVGARERSPPTKRMTRSNSMDAGVFLLKMFLTPFSFDGKRKKCKDGCSLGGGAACAKVSPKPGLVDGGKEVDGDCCDKKSGYADDSSTASFGRRNWSACYSFITRNKTSGRLCRRDSI